MKIESREQEISAFWTISNVNSELKAASDQTGFACGSEHGPVRNYCSHCHCEAILAVGIIRGTRSRRQYQLIRPANSTRRTERRRNAQQLQQRGAAAAIKKFIALTARKNVARVRSWQGVLGLGYSQFDCHGGWPASEKVYVAEKSMEIQIIAPETARSKIELLCYAIKALNKQEEVLLNVEEIPETRKI